MRGLAARLGTSASPRGGATSPSVYDRALDAPEIARQFLSGTYEQNLAPPDARAKLLGHRALLLESGDADAALRLTAALRPTGAARSYFCDIHPVAFSGAILPVENEALKSEQIGLHWVLRAKPASCWPSARGRKGQSDSGRSSHLWLASADAGG